MADKDLQVRFVGNTSDLAGNIDGVSGKFGVFAKGVAAAGAAVGTGLLAAGKGLLDIGATFDSVSDNIRSTTGATGAALDGLVGSAKNVGTQVPSSFEDVSVAVGGLHQRLGITGPALEGMAAQVLDLSRLTGTDLKTNIDSVTRVFGDWGIKTADQANTMDKLFVASQQTGVGVDKLSENVVKFGAPLRQLGFNFDQSIALLGKFEKEGVNTELVMGSMRIALGKMAKAGQDPVATFREITEKIKNAGDAGTANKLALELFGAKAGPDMAAAIREGRFAIDDLVKTIGGSEGAIQAAAEGTADFAEQWQILKNKAFVALEPVAARVFGMINERMSQLADWFERNQSTVQSFAAGLGAGFGIVVDVIGTVVAAVFFLGQALAPVVAFLGRNLTPILIGLSP
ncbi:MAG: phage tail tape measure protein, partial [Pseudonocardiaceae bacterium]